MKQIKSLFIGRWQPLHDGHRALIQTALDQGNVVIIGIRNTDFSKDNPYSLIERQEMIWAAYGNKVKTFVIPDFDEICYGRRVGYAFREIHLDDQLEAISGTLTREALLDQQGLVVWFTGRPCAGKTTIAKMVAVELGEAGIVTTHLDGNAIRRGLSKDLGFTKEDRFRNIERVATLAQLLEQRGVVVLCSFITPYRAQREQLRKQLQNYIEVYVGAPLSVCETRDMRGMYAKARRGEIENFTGIDDPYEVPVQPDVTCYTAGETPRTSMTKVVDYLYRQGHIQQPQVEVDWSMMEDSEDGKCD